VVVHVNNLDRVFSSEYKNQLANLQKLFGLTVDNPWLLDSGALKNLLSLPQTPGLTEALKQVQRAYRSQADRKLYGFDL
ncbi:MAG: hypothetical protein AABX71_02330, partial [Nanoarchaeota archaeon]